MMISRRNFLAVAGAAAAAAALTACGGSSASSTSTASSAAASTASSAAEGGEKIVKVALTCDTGTIDDESFNQACWTAVSSYMGDDCQYYIPEADAHNYRAYIFIYSSYIHIIYNNIFKMSQIYTVCRNSPSKVSILRPSSFILQFKPFFRKFSKNIISIFYCSTTSCTYYNI